MIRGIIWDVDGVILDSMGIWGDAGARYLRTLNIQAAPNLGEVLWDMSLDEGAAYMKKTYSLDLSAKEIVQGIVKTVEKFYNEDVQLKPGVMLFLEKLASHDIKMSVASTSDKKYLIKAFDRLGISNYFAQIFTPAEAGAGKTSPKIYEICGESMGIGKDNILVFEDALYALKTAEKAGFKTVGIYDKYSEKDQGNIKELADFYLRDLTDFESFWDLVIRKEQGGCS